MLFEGQRCARESRSWNVRCNSYIRSETVKLNPEAPEFEAKPKRDAAKAAELRIKDIVQEDNADI